MIKNNILNWIIKINIPQKLKYFPILINISIFSSAIFLSVICTSILKERVEKIDDLNIEYKKLETIYIDVLKKSYDTCNDKILNKDGCAELNDAKSHLDQTKQQIIMIKNIENRGSPASTCGSISSIASGLPGFESECYKYENKECIMNDSKNSSCFVSIDTAPDNRLVQIMYNDFKENFKYSYFDHFPSEILYLILVMASSIIGTIYKLKSELRKIYDLNINDITTSLSQGFIAYIVIMGAKYFVVLGNQQLVTNINPYSIALVGCLSGMLFDSFFNIIPKDKKEPPHVNGATQAPNNQK